MEIVHKENNNINMKKGLVISMFKGFMEEVNGSVSGYYVFEYGAYLSLAEKMKKQYEAEEEEEEEGSDE